MKKQKRLTKGKKRVIYLVKIKTRGENNGDNSKTNTKNKGSNKRHQI